MAMSQNQEEHSNGEKSEVTKSSSTSEEDNLVMVEQGVTINVPKHFFNDYCVKGTVFKLRTVEMNGEKVAVKWVRKSHRCGFENHIDALQNAADTTSSLLASFKKRVNTRCWDIKVVTPLQGTTETLEIGVEPFLENVELFNTNSFWECNTHRTYQKLVVAFSHFSYVASKGEYVLTNLQGGVDEKQKIVTLLSPNLVSDKSGKYGCMDVGAVGAFFVRHTCNSFCQDIPKPEVENKEDLTFHFGQD